MFQTAFHPCIRNTTNRAWQVLQVQQHPRIRTSGARYTTNLIQTPADTWDCVQLQQLIDTRSQIIMDTMPLLVQLDKAQLQMFRPDQSHQ
jgi:hypothetical protein